MLVAQKELPFAIESGTFLEQIGAISPPDSLWGKLYKGAFFDRACYDITHRDASLTFSLKPSLLINFTKG